MSESKSISGPGNTCGERDEAQRMSGEGGHVEISYSQSKPMVECEITQRIHSKENRKQERERGEKKWVVSENVYSEGLY